LLRPSRFSEYVGQPQVVRALEVAVKAARQRGEPLDHLLLYGPPGVGKTTLARIIAAEMEVNLVVTAGPALERGGDLLGILTNLNRGDVLFIDEIHRLPKPVEEFLYPAMEEFSVDFVFDKGAHARSYRYRLEEFTLIGATTRPGMLSAPLRERFGLQRHLDFYSVEELEQVVKRSASILEVELANGTAREIARRARGTPRIANRLLRRVVDYAQVMSDGLVDLRMVREALELEGVDEEGLTDLDRKFLLAILQHYNGGPVGIEALAATLQEEVDTLLDVVEPFLLKRGFVVRLPSGRKATERAKRHLGLT